MGSVASKRARELTLIGPPTLPCDRSGGRRRRPSDRNPNGPRPAASGQAGLGCAANAGPRDRARPRPAWPGTAPAVGIFSKRKSALAIHNYTDLGYHSVSNPA